MNWRPLPLSTLADAQLPPLLISATFTEDSYAIRLTDLTYIWSEELDRKAIIRRSRDENTSIDPSSGDQFSIFLDKIKLGLAGGKDTTCALWVESETGRPSLVLNVTIKLPGGLAPLEWPIRLSAAPQATMTSQFVLPLMTGQRMRRVELESLRGILKDKDHIIEKLMDKLKSLGTDLGQVFPQAAAKAGKKGDWNADRVKGLAAFDMGDWRHGLQMKSLQPSNLIGEVFDSERPLDGEIQASEHEVGDWWEDKKGMTLNLVTGESSQTAEVKRDPEEKQHSKSPMPFREQSSKNDDSEEEDGFQVQEMPVDRRPQSGDAMTDDGKDTSPPSPPLPPVSKTKKKLGTVGKKQTDNKPPVPPPDDDNTSAEATATSSNAVAKPKKALGKIGGKKQPPPVEADPEPEVELEPAPEPVVDSDAVHRTSTPEPTAAKPKRKLGQIGGKKKKEATPATEFKLEPSDTTMESASMGSGTADKNQESIAGSQKQGVEGEDATRGRSAIKKERTPTPPPRETSAERADKKREQLKRELEQKAKAPVKKKRKF